MKYESIVEKNIATISVTMEKTEFEDFTNLAYQKEKSKYSVKGFRKGMAPKGVIESTYGLDVFYDEAFKLIFDKYYVEIIEKEKLDVIDSPDLDVKSMDDKELKFNIIVPVFPEIKLGAYTDLTFTKAKVEVTEDDIKAELDEVKKQSVRKVEVKDRALKDGDIATIDFEGKVDGVVFQGGTAKNHELKIGSHTFVDTFEEQLIGMNVDETRDVTVKFPDNYVEELKGKTAVFTVVLHKIVEEQYPELDDEFASEHSSFETMAEYKEDIRKNIQAEKERKAEYDLEEDIIKKISETTEIDIPQVLIERQLDDDMKNIEANLMQQGISLDIYCKYVQTTPQKIREDRRQFATESVKNQLVIQEIVKKENLKAEEDELNTKLDEYAKNMRTTREELVEKNHNIVNRIENSIIIEKLFKMLKEKNNIQ